jgi:RNA polymerase sigma factor (sigma-70 family)
MVAMVLGTALSALGSTGAAVADARESTLRAVADMSRYCTTCWRNARLHPDCWGDCTQEVLSRMLERVEPDAWDRVLQSDGEERKEFLRAIDTVKKRSQRQRCWSSSAIDTVADHNGPRERRLAEERDTVRQAAEALLSVRQQRILQMSFEGWSVHEIAAELKTPAQRVSDEKYKAIRKLREHLVG